MTHFSWSLVPDVADYLNQIGLPEPEVLKKLRHNTRSHRLAKMAIAPEQANFLVWLVKLLHAKNYLEIGVFTGYSSTAIALALPDDGQITACDINASFTEYAQEAWKQANVAHKIDLHLQPALFTLDELIESGRKNFYDLALIDADKPSTPEYFAYCLELVRTGGVIAIDNILLSGKVLQKEEEPHEVSPGVTIMQKFNQELKNNPRVSPITLPLGDGLMLLLKNY